MKRILIAAGILAGIGVLLLAIVVFAQPQPYKGSEFNPANQAPDFSLIDQNNQAYQLSAQKGKVIVMFFGYTYCTDVCPTTLANFAQLRQNLGANADRVETVMVTVDPQRDTPERLNNYLANFGTGITGLTGSTETLQTVWNAYGISVVKKPGTTDQNYTIDHTARIFVIDAQGKLRLTYAIDTPVSDLVSDIQRLLQEG